MAKFAVGDKVRFIGSAVEPSLNDDIPVGSEGTVIRNYDESWRTYPVDVEFANDWCPMREDELELVALAKGGDN